MMLEFASGGAVEGAVRSYLERQAPVSNGTALFLALSETDADGVTRHWRGCCAIGIGNDAIAALEAPGENAAHPLALTAHSEALLTGEPNAAYGDLLGQHFWCAAVVWPGAADDATPPRGVLVALQRRAFTARQRGEIERIAQGIGLLFAGAEAALSERRESDQLALLMRYAANPIILSDASTIISMNDPAARLFDVTPLRDPEEQIPAVARNLQQLQSFLSSVTTEEHKVHTGEMTLEDPATQEMLIMGIASSHVPDALGGQSGMVSVLHDMTRARELEHHRVRQQLFESEKLAATGRMAASIAHEINNPLEAIKNSLYLLVHQTGPDDPNRQFLELAQHETERVSRIIRQMLGVSRPSVTFAPTDVNEIMREALQLLGPQLRQGHVETTVQLDERLPLVQASADQLKQVFLNLVLNAQEAMPEGAVCWCKHASRTRGTRNSWPVNTSSSASATTAAAFPPRFCRMSSSLFSRRRTITMARVWACGSARISSNTTAAIFWHAAWLAGGRPFWWLCHSSRHLKLHERLRNHESTASRAYA